MPKKKSEIRIIADQLRKYVAKQFGKECCSYAEGCTICEAWESVDHIKSFADYCDELDKLK